MLVELASKLAGTFITVQLPLPLPLMLTAWSIGPL